MVSPMRIAIAACILIMLQVSSLSLAARNWEKKPYTEWSLSEAHKIIWESPWVTLSSAAPFASRATNGFYQARLLSARPMAEAFLRQGALESAEPTVSVQEIHGPEAEREKARLQKYLASEKGKFMAQLDHRFIVLSLTIRSGKEIFKDERLPSRFADLHPPTTLSTDTGKQVRLARFIPPDKHELGALFYFPRTLQNGTPLVSANDRELRFKATVQGNVLTAKFNLKKMTYKDKLEF